MMNGLPALKRELGTQIGEELLPASQSCRTEAKAMVNHQKA